MSDSDFEAKVKSVMKSLYPVVTNQLKIAEAVDNMGVVPPDTMSLRERVGRRMLFVWGSRWGGRRSVGG